MISAIERLRATKEAFLKTLEDAGKMAGYAWGQESASYRQLLLLSRIDTEAYGAERNEISMAVLRALDPNHEVGSRNLSPILFGAKEWPEPEWLVGWVQGAQEFFEGVKDEI